MVIKKIETFSKLQEPDNRHSPNRVIENVERTAGDWLSIGKIEIEIEEDPFFFSFSGIESYGLSIEEVLAPEDMFPAMYRRLFNV